MRVGCDILYSRVWSITKQTCFHIFLCGFNIKASVMHEHVMNNQEHVKNDMNI